MPQVNLALVGFGTIGVGVAELLHEHHALIQSRTGMDFRIRYIVDKDLTNPRRVDVKDAKKTADYREALADPSVSTVLELVGGTNFAYTCIEDSLKAGKHVVTANKALLAERGAPLFALAREKGLTIGFEGSVCGGVPIIRTVSEALSGDAIQSIYGIVNGTTNFILTRMIEDRMDFQSALKEAQRLGFAEADPTLDIGGFDAAHKIAILASLAFNTPVEYSEVSVEGIQGVELEDVQIARELGYILKLLAIAKLDPDKTVEVRVNPTLVPKNNQLASVRNEYNAVLLESAFLGNSMYFGKGAGAHPTATAVVGDLIDIGLSQPRPEQAGIYRPFRNYPVKPIGNIESRYYVRFSVLDKPGILSRISGVFGANNISIASVFQKERSETQYVPLVMTTHLAKEKDMRKALDEIEKSDFTGSRGVMLRIID